jgi:hypothetical protein
LHTSTLRCTKSFEGSSYTQYFEYKKSNGDCAAEAVYTLEGAPNDQHFSLQARQNPKMQIQVKLGGELKSKNNGRGTLFELGYEDSGVVAFSLAGTGDDDTGYLSNNPPVAWMQETLPTIGPRTLQQISMLGSHNAGGYEQKCLAKPCPDVIRQHFNVYGQLLNGARFLDIRPALHYNTLNEIRFETSHINHRAIIDGRRGATTATMSSIIEDINRFCDQYPGELIILDLSNDVSINDSLDWRDSWKPFTPLEWQLFWNSTHHINHLWGPKNEEERTADINTLPISTFIERGGESAVVIRVEPRAILPGTLILAEEASINSPKQARHLITPSEEGLSGGCVNHADIALRSISLDLSDGTKSMTSAVNPSDVMKGAVIPHSRFPFSGKESKTESVAGMTEDQIKQMSSLPQEDQIEQMSYQPQAHINFMTLAPDQVDLSGKPCIEEGIDIDGPFIEKCVDERFLTFNWQATKAIFDQLWPAIARNGGNKLPNVVMVDGLLEDRQLLAWCLAVNEYWPREVSRVKRVEKRGIEEDVPETDGRSVSRIMTRWGNGTDKVEHNATEDLVLMIIAICIVSGIVVFAIWQQLAKRSWRCCGSRKGDPEAKGTELSNVS